MTDAAAAHPLLIVNADDYALTPGISRGILRAHRDGIVSSTSVLAVSDAFPIATSWLRDAPRLGVGAHLALVGEDPPLLSRHEVSSLVDRRGAFAPTWRRFLARALRGGVDPEHVRLELTAQLERIRGAGVQVTHLDSHQHLHLWPPIRDAVIRLAREHRIAALRVPRARRLPAAVGVAPLARRLDRAARVSGLARPVDGAGIDSAGRVDMTSLLADLRRLRQAEGPVEIGCHPGDVDPALRRYQWGYRWHKELAALTHPAARGAISSLGFRLGTYADLVETRTIAPERTEECIVTERKDSD